MKLRTSIIAIASLMSMSTMAQANCLISHYYNHSPQAWYVSVPQGVEKVRFDGCAASSNGKCEIAPGKVIVATGSSFTIEITDHTGKSRAFDVEGRPRPNLGNISLCPYIRHSGNTGSVAVNDPADGDINMWGPGQW